MHVVNGKPCQGLVSRTAVLRHALIILCDKPVSSRQLAFAQCAYAIALGLAVPEQ